MKIVLAVGLFLAIVCSVFAGEGREGELIRQGTEYLKVENYQRALKAFGDAARLNPSSFEAQRGLGIAYLKLGSNETASNVEMLGEAAHALKEAVRLTPDSAETRYQLGITCLALQDKNGAQREYESLKGLDPKVAERLRAAISSYRPPASFSTGHLGGGDYETRVTIARNQVLVPVTLSNGTRTVEATLVLDTGASVTVISAVVARSLGIDLRRSQLARAQVVGGGMVVGWHVKLDKVSAGPHSKGGLDVAVIPNPGMADGLLGMNFLRSYQYRIDFANQVINWEP